MAITQFQKVYCLLVPAERTADAWSMVRADAVRWLRGGPSVRRAALQ